MICSKLMPSRVEHIVDCGVTLGLEKYVDYFAILVNRSPQVVLLAIDFHKNFSDEEGIAIASLLTFQAAGINDSELYTPKSDRLSIDTVFDYKQVFKDYYINDDRWPPQQQNGSGFIYSRAIRR